MTASTRLSAFAIFTTVLASTFSPTTQPSAIPPTASPTTPRFYFGQSGDLGPLTYGSKVREGTLAAFRQINDNGGVFGHLLDLISYDDNGNYNLTMINTQNFIDQKVVACMNYIGLDGIEHAMPMLEAAGIPMLMPATGARQLRLPVNRHILHTRASLDEEAHAWVNYCIARSLLTLSVYYQDDDDGAAGFEALQFALNNQGVRFLSVAKLTPGNNATLAGLLNPINASLTIAPQAIALLVPPDQAVAFIKLAKARWPLCLFYVSSTFGQQTFLDALIANNITANVTADIFVTSAFPIPVSADKLPPASTSWVAAKSTLLLDFATAMNVTCSNCTRSFGRLEGYLAGGMVASILTHMLDFDYTSPLFRPYLDRHGVNASGVSETDDATLGAWRELLIDTIYRESMFDVSGVKLGPYYENITCNSSSGDCIQPVGTPCNQGMSHVYLIQPNVINQTYVELTEWRAPTPSCNFYSLPPEGEPPLVFGQSGLLSGPAGGLASDMRNGILSAFAEANMGPSKGVRGRKLLLMTVDDLYQGPQALTNAMHFIHNQSLVAILGAVGDDSTEAVTSVYFNASLPFIGPNCGARFVRDSSVIAVRALYDDEAAAMVSFARSRGLTKLSIFRQLAAFGNGGYDGFTLAMKYHKMPIFSEAGYPKGATFDIPGTFANLTKNGIPEMVILFSSISVSGRFIKEAFNMSAWDNTIFIVASISDVDREPGVLTPAILASGRVYGSTVVPSLRNGSFFQQHATALRLIDSKLFKYGIPYNPTLASLEGYLIGRLVIAGLARVTDFTGRAMLDDLIGTQTINISSFRLGPYSDKCNMGLRTTYIVRFENSTTEPFTQVYEHRPSSSNQYIPDCGAYTVYNTSFTCPAGYDKQSIDNSTMDSYCKLCLSEYGCTLPEREANQAMRSAMLALNIIGFLVATVFAGIVYRYRFTTTIRATSPPFCMLIIVGAMLAYTFVFVQFPAMPTAESCMAQVYLINTASCLLFGSLFAKVFRVTRIFQPRDQNSFRILAIPNLILFGGVGVMWVIEMIYTIAWHATSPLVPVQASNPRERYWVCQSDQPMWGVVDVLGNGLFLLYGVVLSIQSRRVPTLFNEAKFVASTMYNTFILGAIAVLLAYEVAANDDQLYLFKSLGVFLVITVDLLLLVASKFPSLYAEVVHGIIPQYKKDSSGASSTRTQATGKSDKSGDGNASSHGDPQSTSERATTEGQTPSSRDVQSRPSAQSRADQKRGGPSVLARIEAEMARTPSKIDEAGSRVSKTDESDSRPVSKIDEMPPTTVSVVVDKPNP